MIVVYFVLLLRFQKLTNNYSYHINVIKYDICLWNIAEVWTKWKYWSKVEILQNCTEQYWNVFFSFHHCYSNKWLWSLTEFNLWAIKRKIQVWDTVFEMLMAASSTVCTAGCLMLLFWFWWRLLKVQAKVKPERDHTCISLGDKNWSLPREGG